jgi:hypothetical protein
LIYLQHGKSAGLALANRHEDLQHRFQKDNVHPARSFKIDDHHPTRRHLRHHAVDLRPKATGLCACRKIALLKLAGYNHP